MRIGPTIAAALVFSAFILFMPSLPQDPAYHVFADRRTLFGIAHFWNVVSNLPFLLVGVMGTVAVVRNRTPGYLAEIKPAYVMFFAGVACTGVASAWYHLSPDNHTLVWDRLALSAVFMAFFASVWAEHISIEAGRQMLWPLIGIGMAAVLYWYGTEIFGRGDLRFYAAVQFLPMLWVPAILLRYRSRMTGVAHLWAMLAAYGLAKLAELLDDPLYRALGGFSGHEIKHWVAGAGIFIYYRAGFKRRRRWGGSTESSPSA